jgi:UDP-N-acetylglucosamine 2-epimerase (hydrolysing)
VEYKHIATFRMMHFDKGIVQDWHTQTVSEFINQRSGDPQDIILSKTIQGFSDYVCEVQPDAVIFHGDRIEALACGIVCATNQIFSIHIEGGEVSGTIDEQIRHCNTKLARVHLVASEKAKCRVMQLGEPTESVFVIGSPELDLHSYRADISIEEVRRYYEIKNSDFGICIFHPVTTEVKSIERQAESLFDALTDTGKYFVVILPNNDPGVLEIRGVISKLMKRQFRVLPSMRFSYFSCLLQNAKIIVGNSSTGVREAPFLGVPSIDIGTRQHNRKESLSVFCASALEGKLVTEMVQKLWGKRFAKDISYGVGDARGKFISLLLSTDFWSAPLQKSFVDMVT